MTEDPKPARGLKRGVLYAMIPIGFLVIVLFLVTSGVWTQETTDDAPVVVEEPPSPLDE